MSNARLISGDIVASDSDEWRRETLARHILSLPFAERRPWIEDHAKRASKEAAEMLRQDVKRMHGAKS